jgi:SepF-like predicted cell division protein (DUF552 family)
MPFRGLFGKGDSRGGDIDVEDYLNELSIRDGRIVEDKNVTYVKSVMLDAEGKGIGTVVSELERGNIVVLNVKALLANRVLLREIVKELRDACMDLDGDLGRVSDEKILIVPAGMRIAHMEAPGEEQ